MKNTSKNNRNYLITNRNNGLDIEFSTSRPNAKRAKTLTLKTKNQTLKLNGYQINTLKRVFAKENALNSSK